MAGRTPVHWAVERNYTDSIEILLEYSTDCTSMSNDGYTLLRTALKWCNENTLNALIRLKGLSGLRMDLCDANGFSVKMLAEKRQKDMPSQAELIDRFLAQASSLPSQANGEPGVVMQKEYNKI